MKGSLKIWMVLLGMVIIGIGITCLTNTYVSRQIEKMAATAGMENSAGEFLSIETAAEDAGEKSMPEGKEKVIDIQTEKTAEESQREWQEVERENGAEDGIGQEDVEVSEDTAIEAEAGFAEEAEGKSPSLEIVEYSEDLQEALGEYRERFPQIDKQIEQMRIFETENTMYSVKNAAQTELRIWEREMESLYRLLCDSLDEAACQQLQKEQQEWIQQRDSLAEEAAKKNSGGSLESVDYIASAAASSRERAYALLEKYQK